MKNLLRGLSFAFWEQNQVELCGDMNLEVRAAYGESLGGASPVGQGMHSVNEGSEMVRNEAALGKGQGIGVAWRQIWGGLGLAFMGEVSDCAVLEANKCLAWFRG